MADEKWVKESNYYKYQIDDSVQFSIKAEDFSFSETASESYLKDSTYFNINSTTSTVTIVNAEPLGYDGTTMLQAEDGKWKFVFNNSEATNNSTVTLTHSAWDVDGHIANLYANGAQSKYSFTGNATTGTTITQSWESSTPAVVIKGLKNDVVDATFSDVSTTTSITIPTTAYLSSSEVSISGSGYAFTFSDTAWAVVTSSNTSLIGSSKNDSLTATGFDEGFVSINGGAGDDQITVSGVTITQASKVEGGAGSDTFVFSNVTVSASATFNVSDSAGSETYTITNVSVGSNATFAIDDSEGNDTFNISSSTGISIGGTGAGSDTFIISSSTAITIVSGENDSDSLNLDMAAGNIGISLSNFNAKDIISLSGAASSATSTIESTTGVITFTVSGKTAKVSLGTADMEDADELEALYKMRVYNGNETPSLLGDVVDPYVWSSSTTNGVTTLEYKRKNTGNEAFSITGLTGTFNITNGAFAENAGIELVAESTVKITNASILGTAGIVLHNSTSEADGTYKFAFSNNSLTSETAITTAIFEMASDTGATSSGTAKWYTSGNITFTISETNSETITSKLPDATVVLGGVSKDATSDTVKFATGAIDVSSTAIVNGTAISILSGNGYSFEFGGNIGATFVVNDSNTSVMGTAGNDTFNFGSRISNTTLTDSISINGGAGSDTFNATGITVTSGKNFVLDGGEGKDTFNITGSSGVSIVSAVGDSDTFSFGTTANAVVSISGADISDSIKFDHVVTGSIATSDATLITFESGASKIQINLDGKKASDLYEMNVVNGGTNEKLGNIINPYVWTEAEGGIKYDRKVGGTGLFTITGLDSDATSAAAKASSTTIAGLAVNIDSQTVTISSATLLGESEVKITGTGYKFNLQSGLSNTSKAALWTYASETAALNTASLAASGTKLNYATNADSTTVIFTPENSAFVIGGINSETKLTAVDAGGTIEISSNTYVSGTPMKITKNEGYSVSLGGAAMLEVSAFASGTSIIGSSGADTITASGTTTVASSIFGGAGNDSIVIEGLTFNGSGELYVSGDSGTDTFDITGITAGDKLTIGAGDGNDTINLSNSTGISIVSGNDDSDTFNFNTASATSVSITGFTKDDIISLSSALDDNAEKSYSSGTLKLGKVTIKLTDSASLQSNDASALYGLKVWNGSTATSATKVEDLIDPMEWAQGKGTSVGTYTFGRTYGSETARISIGAGLHGDVVNVLGQSTTGKTVTVDHSLLGIESVSFSVAGGYNVTVAEGASNTRVAGFAFENNSTTAKYMNTGSTTYTVDTENNIIVASDARVAAVVIEGLNGTTSSETGNLTKGSGSEITIANAAFGAGAMTISSGTGYSFTFNSTEEKGATVSVGVSDVTVVGAAGNDSLYAEGQNNISLSGAGGDDTLVVNGGTGVSLYGGTGSDTFVLDSDAKVMLTDLRATDGDKISLASTAGLVFSETAKALTVGGIQISISGVDDQTKLAKDYYNVSVNGSLLGDIIDPKTWTSDTNNVGTYIYGRQYTDTALISIGGGLVGTSDTILDSLSGAMSETSTGATLQVEAGMLGTEEVAFSLSSANYAVSLGTSGTSDTKEASAEWKFSGSYSDTAVLLGAGTFTYTLGTNKITVSDSRASEVKLTGLNGADGENVTSDTGNVVTVASDAFVSEAAMTIVKGENYSFVFGEDGTKSANVIVADSNVTVTGTAQDDTLAAAGQNNISLFGNGGDDIFSISGGSDVTLTGSDGSDTFVFSGNVTGAITALDAKDTISLGAAVDSIDFDSTTHTLKLGENIAISINNVTNKEALANADLYNVTIIQGTTTSLLGNIIDPIDWSSNTTDGKTTFTYGRKYAGTELNETGLITIDEGLADTVDSGILKNATSNSTLTLTAAMISIPAADDSSKDDNGFIDSFASFEVNSELGYTVTFTDGVDSATANVDSSWIIEDSTTAKFYTAGSITYSISIADGNGTISASDTRTNPVIISGLSNATSDAFTDADSSNVTISNTVFSDTMSIDSGTGYSFTFASANGKGAYVEVGEGVSDVLVTGSLGADTLSATVEGTTNVTLDGGAGNDVLTVSGGTGISLFGGAGNDSIYVTDSSDVTLTGGTKEADTFVFDGAFTGAITDLESVDAIYLSTEVTPGTDVEFDSTTKTLKLGKDISVSINNIAEAKDLVSLYGATVYNGGDTSDDSITFGNLVDPMVWTSSDTASGTTFIFGRAYSETARISIGEGLKSDVTTESLKTAMEDEEGNLTNTVSITAAMLGEDDVKFSVSGGYSVSLAADITGNERAAGWEISGNGSVAAYMNEGSTTYTISISNSVGTITASDTRTVGAQISGLTSADSATNITLTADSNISVGSSAIGSKAISIDSGDGYTFTFGSTAESGATVTAISNITVIGGEGADSLYAAVGNVSLNGGAGNDTLSINGTSAITGVSLTGGDGSDTFLFNGSVSAAISGLSKDDDSIRLGTSVASGTFEGGVLKLGNVSITASNVTSPDDFSALYGLKVYNGSTDTSGTKVEDLIDVKEWDSQTGGSFTYGRDFGDDKNLISIGAGLADSVTENLLNGATTKDSITIKTEWLGIEDVSFTAATGYGVSLETDAGTTGNTRAAGWEISGGSVAAYMNSGTTTYSIVSAAGGGTIKATDERTVGAQISGLNGASATTVSLTSDNNISVAAGAIGTTAISIDSGEDYSFTLDSAANGGANVVTKVDKVTIVGGAGADTVGFSGLTSISSASIVGGEGADVFNVSNISINGTTAVDGGAGDDTFNISSVVGGGNLVITGGAGKDSISITNSTGISIVSGSNDSDTFVFDGASAATASISNFDTTDIFKFTTAVASGSVSADYSTVQFTTNDGGTINITLDGVTASEVYTAKVYNGSKESLLEDIVDPYTWQNNAGTLTLARRTKTSDSLFAIEGLGTISISAAQDTATGVAGVTLNADSTVTIAQSALTTNDVSITTAFGYNLSLAADVKAPTSSDAVWSISGDGNDALYIAPMYASIAGYEIASVDTDSDGTSETTYIKYSEAETPDPMATISGLGANGLKVESLTAATNGAYITFTNNMLPENKADVVITNAKGYTYKLKLAADAKTSTTDASWSVSSKKDVVIYTQESLKGGWELDGDSITAVDGKGGDKVSISGLYNAKLNAKKTVNGVTYDSGTSTFIISNSLLNNTLHTANVTGTTASVVASISAKDGVTGNDDSTYKVALAADVPSYSTTREQYWDVPSVGTANYYADKGSIAGYNVVSGDETKIKFKAAQHPDVTISLAGLSNKATVKNDNISGLTVNSETSTVKIAANLVGTNGASITTSVKDYTYTLAGKGKLINAQANAVTLQGSTGNDTLQDTVTAAISLNGGKGNDVIIANGNDSVDMGAGNDAVTLAGGNNTVIYTAGKDVINGFTATDSIDIGDKTVKESTYNGTDLTLTIGTGSLTFKGAANTSVTAGADKNIYYQNYVYDSLKSAVTVGAGYTTTTLTSLASSVSSIDASKVAKGLNISLNSANALNIIGTSKKDTIYGSTGKDSLYGGAGNDVIYGGDGDSLTGGKDNDTFVYTGGNVIITDFDAKKDKISLSGGSNSSLAVANAASVGSDLVLTLNNTAKNTITLAGKSSLADSAITINGTAVIFGNNYIVDAKKTSATLNSGADGSKLTSYSSMITIDGSAATSNLTLTGNAKANKITAGSGNDTLNGGKGNDTLVGGTGKDIFVYAVGEGKDVIADFTVGDKDQLSIVSGGNSADISVITGATYNSGNLALTIGKQAVTLQGSLSSAQQITINDKGYYFGENQIFDSGKTATTLYSAFKGSYDATTDTKVATIDGSGVTSAVQLTGNAINNTITGGKKNDTIDGGAGNDSINGGAGNDSLYGGAGNDTLTGGAGKDVFAFKANEGTDTITDYAAGDKIQFLDGSAAVTWLISGKDVVFKYGSGQITATDAAGKKITTVDSTGKTTTKKYDNATYTKTNGELYEASAASSKNFDLFEDNNFITDDTDLDSITDNKVAVTQIQDNKDEITQAQDLLTYSDDK